MTVSSCVLPRASGTTIVGMSASGGPQSSFDLNLAFSVAALAGSGFLRHHMDAFGPRTLVMVGMSSTPSENTSMSRTVFDTPWTMGKARQAMKTIRATALRNFRVPAAFLYADSLPSSMPRAIDCRLAAIFVPIESSGRKVAERGEMS